jgi:hypothetical protein
MAKNPTTFLPPGPGIAKSALCQSMDEKASKTLDRLNEFKQGFRNGLNDLRDTLSNMSWSPPADVLDKINQIANKAGDLIPDLSDFDKLIDMMKSCANLGDIGDATTLVKQTTGPLLSNANRAINEITQAMPEFDAVNTFNELLSHVQTNKVDLEVNGLKGALACLYHICGVDVQSKLDNLNGFLNSCSLNGDGKLDPDKVLDSSGITTPEKRAAFKSSQTAVSNVYNNVNSSVDNGVARVKSLTKNLPLP